MIQELTFNDLRSQGIVCIRACIVDNRRHDIAKFKKQLVQANAQGWPTREIEAALKKAEKELTDIEKLEFSVVDEAVEGFAYSNDREYRRVVRVSEETIAFEPNRNSREQGSCTVAEWAKWVGGATSVVNEGEKYNVKLRNVEAMLQRAMVEHDNTKKELIDKGIARERKHVQ